MKSLTLKHPWAFCVAHLGKDVENRSWKPPANLIGQYFAIHGGAEPKGRDLAEAEDALIRLKYSDVGRPGLTIAEAITPGIVAVVRLAGVVTASDSLWFHGPIGWRLADVFTLSEPIVIKGAQGLWTVPDEIVAEIRRQYAEKPVAASG